MQGCLYALPLVQSLIPGQPLLVTLEEGLPRNSPAEAKVESTATEPGSWGRRTYEG